MTCTVLYYSHLGITGYYLLKSLVLTLNPLSPRDALKHHFTSMKTHLIFLQQRGLEWIFP